MKKLLLAFVGTLFFVSVLKADEYQDKITEYFISDQQPLVIVAEWDGTRHFKIGVVNDGKNMHEIAENTCYILHDKYGYFQRGLDVTVYDSDQIKANNTWVRLDKAYCRQ